MTDLHPADLARCSELGCPVRFRLGADRLCRMHDHAALLDLTPESDNGRTTT
jgi:hypothetical protein